MGKKCPDCGVVNENEYDVDFVTCWNCHANFYWHNPEHTELVQ